MIHSISLYKIIRYIGLSCIAISAMTASLSVLNAGLVPNGGDLDKDSNNALRFDPATPTPAKVAFVDANLPLDRYIQVGFSTTNSTAINISEIAWSKDNVTYNSFTPNDFVNNVISGGGVRSSSIIDLGSPIGGSSTTRFFLRYTLPSGIGVDSVVQSIFYANSNGAASGGILADEFGNNFVSITRSHTAVPEPTSLMLVTTAALLLRWRLRRR